MFGFKKEQKRRPQKGLSETVIEVGTTVVVLFIVLFMIAKVAGITAIDSTSDFYTVYQNLTDGTTTVYDVLLLLVIVAVLGIAIYFIKRFKRGGETSVV